MKDTNKPQNEQLNETAVISSFTHGSLFSGIDGFGLAADWIGWQNVFHCEINPILSEFLKQQYPNATNYTDITKADFTIWRGRIDVLTGGFPCQPYSQAGKRKGTADERHLWPQMLRAIREIQPTWIVGENVRGIINWSNGLVFHEVQTDLENEGYEVQPHLLPASGVNAPHERYRTWFIAYSDKYRNNRIAAESNIKKENTTERTNIHKQTFRSGTQRTTSNPDSFRCDDRSSDDKKYTNDTGFDALGNIEQSDGIGIVTNPKSSGKRGLSITNEKARASESNITPGVIHRIQNVTDTIGIRGKQNNGKRKSKQSNQNSKVNYWSDFPTQSPVCIGDDGISSELLRSFIIDNCNGLLTEKEVDQIISKTINAARNETIKAGGNAVVPQVVLQIFKSIKQYENGINSRKTT